jgi:hypothetical protein
VLKSRNAIWSYPCSLRREILTNPLGDATPCIGVYGEEGRGLVNFRCLMRRAGLEDKRARCIFRAWRDEIGQLSRKVADYHWFVPGRSLSWGLHGASYRKPL